MSNSNRQCFLRHLAYTVAALAAALHMVGAGFAADAEKADKVLDDCGIPGGLCVEVGCPGTAFAARVAQGGRFLVHVLDADPAAVDKARKQLDARGLYGLASAERLNSSAGLPYTENLVNLLVIEDRPGVDVPAAEMVRVLCPGGVVFAAVKKASQAALKAAGLEDVREVEAGGRWIRGRKPWPAGMDSWTHPRHAADGNAVSRDTLVAPPRRIRWVTGPPRENNRMVTAAGRNFYADVLARDSFNGLRLWHRPLKPGGRYAAPVAAGELLFAVSGKKVLALDGATGDTIREYPGAGIPNTLLHESGTLVGVDGSSVRALDVETGRLHWKYDAAAPRCVVAGDDVVALVRGRPDRGEKCAFVVLDRATGKVRWERDDFPWAAKVRRCVYHQGMLACEISTYSDDGPGNVIHVVSATDGKPLWSHEFSPGMNHAKQARAMFVGDRLWVLHGGKHGTFSNCSALDLRTGQVKATHDAGLCHCFPPVATPRFLFGGEMDLTDLATGRVDAHRITKAACGRDVGWVPANGLINVTPKHCVCWPMLRGYAALAPARPGGSVADKQVEQIEFALEKGVEPPRDAGDPGDDPWPCYRHDAWRSGSTTAQVSADLKPLWTTELGGWPEGPVADDWRENPFVKGPLTPPVIAGGLLYVARPDAHQLVALDTRTGAVRWRFTANGRIDTPPTIHGGLCLFGSKSGWVYCLRADNGKLVWRLRAAPVDERIVAYGQIESPWPVPGSVLVVDEVAYFAAGRQGLADGGILVFAVEPPSGKIRWVKRLDSVPQTAPFYDCNALEFDNFDLLHREGNSVAMSRWLFDRAGGRMTVKAKDAFALLATGGSGVMVPRGCWTYAPRHEPRQRKIPSPLRPLVVFRDNTLMGCSQNKQTVYRRDFDFAGGEQFDPAWITGWALSERTRKGNGEAWRSQRLAKGAKWSVEVLPDAPPGKGVAAMVLTRNTLFAAGSQGGLTALAAEDGKLLAEHDLPVPVWDGMAAAAGRLFVSTRDGRLICLGLE